MNSLPFIPDTAPFPPEQRAWLNGFFAGIFSRQPAASPSTPAPLPAAPLIPVTILFGSQTGTAEALAKRAAREAGKRSFAATVLDMAQCDLAKLAGERNVLVITSTFGDGEPPDNARALHATLATASTSPATTPRLAQLRFSVCALGDTNYTLFCKCGADFDHFLEQLGARRLIPRAECDLDGEAMFTTWLDQALTAFGASEVPSPIVAAPASDTQAPTVALVSPSIETGYSRGHPFAARVLTSRNLNGPGSAKQVHHVEFDLGDSALSYEAGDALGVFPHNCRALVADVLGALGCDGEEAVPAPDGATTSLRHALTEFYDLGRPTRELTDIISRAPAGTHSTSVAAAEPSAHVIDVLHGRGNAPVSPADFVRTLKKLQPRLYSISSSPLAHRGQVHLTVGAVRYVLKGRSRSGTCSTFLTDRVVPGDSRVRIFVHRNAAFRPPASADTPMIMIGPGTGIAPFRGFLHDRRARGARGRSWLFFGDQCAATDFLYADELAEFQRDGTLHRLDTAFSRDQAQKVYVQHRMLENARELFDWLESGAHVYVCGDAARMAKDVDAALHTAVEQGGGRNASQAVDYVQSLKAGKRYCRDVY